MRAIYTCCLGAFVLACGGSTVGSTPDPVADAGPDDSATTPDAVVANYPAFLPDMPRVIASGGPVLKAPSVTPVFFPGFSFPTEMTEMTAKIGASKYWEALTEYGIGPITQSAPIVLTPDLIVPADIGPITDEQIQAWLISRFDGTHAEFGNDPDTTSIYTLFYPAQTVISLQNSKSCQSFGGYHGNVTIKGQLVAYAVIPQCPSFGSQKAVDGVSAVVSHELSEAVTDPFPFDQPAYTQVDQNHFGWMFYLGGGEIGDLCAQFSASLSKPADIGYTVQSNWSNANAKAGHDPCQPAPDGQVYFNSMPALNDKVMSRGASTKGVKVAVGETKVIPVSLYSDAPTSGPWTVTVTSQNRNGTSPFKYALDKSSGQNGDVLNLSITGVTAVSGQSGTSTFVVTSQLGSRRNIWIGLAGN